MGLIKKTIILTTIIIAVSALILGYYGFVPVISEVMGANKPKDLGVTYTIADLTSANAKLGVIFKTLPPTDSGAASLTRTGQKQLIASFTSAELTALLNDHSQKWKYYPINDIQVKINNDGVIELSGVLQADRFTGFADAVQVSESSRGQVRPYLYVVSSNPSIYMKGSLSITNNVVQTDIQSVEVGRLSVSGDQLNSYKGALDSFIQDRANGRIIKINSASFKNGQVYVDALIPQELGLTPP
ncbi:MAG: hypothetical protein NTV15_05390 [Candidatus Bathyarchaeota archaeon]|nr:hypothetical protein [Candidatus Bathyarchaeota archaeon]